MRAATVLSASCSEGFGCCKRRNWRGRDITDHGWEEPGSLKMTEFLQKRGKKRNEDGIGSVVDFLLANARLVLGVGGAVMLGIATLAVKRLIERATSPPDDKEEDGKVERTSVKESWKEMSLINSSPKLLQRANRAALSEPLPPTGRSQLATVPPPHDGAEQETVVAEVKMIQLSSTLQEKLLDYYRNHIAIPESEVSQVKQLAKAIGAELQEFLCSKHPEMPFGALYLGGSLVDDLQAVRADHVCFMLPLVLESTLWSFIPGEDTILNNPKVWMVKRKALECFVRGSSPWDRFTVGGYLSSTTFIESLRKILVGSINWPAIGSMLESIIRPVVASEELKLEVSHGQNNMSIAIFPVAKMGETVLLAMPLLKGHVENLWYRSFYTLEKHKLLDLDSIDSGTRRCCLKILKGVCNGHPSLRKLTGSHLTHVILHLCDMESNWTEAALADRFQQVLEELIGYLEKGVLPCYFNSHVNLFSDLLEEEIDELGYILYSAFGAPEALLQKWG
ncbi:mitochondrial dynamics protein MID49 [Rhinatrema bivittatum]|uniref:mitochondrial dynamics protein MID49 n=1 Tax=Rhinatrema bivittatum TaxID=194408 RepID=UPI0011262F61|nr:mitochondrial dynamics protein MID49 [Rhinatrema bivittatum]